MEDIQRSADLFRRVYDRLDGADGFVSLEVSPYLARDTDKTIADAQRLWVAVARPNVMIKVPATIEGLPAIQRLIAEGINVNITLLFGLPMISSDTSPATVRVIRTDEEVMIARAVCRLLGFSTMNEM